MSEKPLFETSRDKTDFFIAILVIGFFLWLFLFSGILGKKYTPDIAKVDLVAASKDSDGDKINDAEDDCPLVYGTSDTGCPLDTDHDGVYDHLDDCPRTSGSGKNGCPDVKVAKAQLDSDHDGVLDINDKCPHVKGTGKDGCPQDRDKDGVPDAEDRCPNIYGSKSNDGCPTLYLKAPDVEILNTALRDVQFETGKATLKPTSYIVLDKIVKLMNKYPRAILNIEGHTDNSASQELNLSLSKQRAFSCKSYLLGKGIDDSRIKSTGYGESRPKASNETEEGKRKNRRVEFNLNY